MENHNTVVNNSEDINEIDLQAPLEPIIIRPNTAWKKERIVDWLNKHKIPNKGKRETNPDLLKKAAKYVQEHNSKIIPQTKDTNPISQDQNLNNSIKLFVHPNETFMCSSAIPETDSIEVRHADHIDITAIPQTENIDVPETDHTNNDMHYESEILDVTELLPELFPPITEDDVELLKSTKSNTIRMPTLRKIAKLIIHYSENGNEEALFELQQTVAPGFRISLS